MPPRGRGRYPQPPAPGGTQSAAVTPGAAPPCSYLGFPWLLALWPCQPVERTLDGGDRAGRDVEIARRGLQFLVTQEHLDLPDIGAAIEQMSGEAVAQRMHRHVFPDPRRVGRFVE